MMAPTLAIYQLVLGRQLSRKRMVVFAVIILLAGGLGIALRRGGLDESEVVEVVAALGLQLAVPVITLTLASAAIGEWLEDETLVYVWLRPISRWVLVLGALGATLTVALPMNLLSTGAIAAFGSGFDSTVVWATAGSVLLATLAYATVFVFLGAVTKRALMIGLGYIFIWEATISNFGDGLARFSIRSYAVSAMSLFSDVGLSFGGRGDVQAIVVPLVVVIVGMAATSWVLDRKDVP